MGERLDGRIGGDVAGGGQIFSFVTCLLGAVILRARVKLFTRGRVAMPFYRDALSQQERWDVINYVKSEFGKQSRPQ